MIFGANFVYAAESNSARNAVLQIRKEIDSHKVSIQSKNSELFKLAPEEIAEADFKNYDTSSVLLGTDLYEFAARSVSNDIKGKDGTINTLAQNEYKVHSTIKYGKYPSIFNSDTVIKTSGGKRATLVADYSDDVPSYQIVKNVENLYVENIDFENFPMIKFENCDNIIFNNCSFTDFENNGIVFRDCSNIAILNSKFTNCGNQILGMIFQTRSKAAKTNAKFLWSKSHSTKSQNSTNFTFCGNSFSDGSNSGYIMRIVGDTHTPAENVLIENCTFENSCGKTISFVGDVDDYVIRNNTINNSVWGAIDYWTPTVSGKYADVIENNVCKNIGFGKPSVNDTNALTSGVGCAAIFAGMGTSLPNTIVKNNVVQNCVETGIEGPYELVYHNTVKNTGENSVARYTGSTEAIYIKPTTEFEQKYIGNTIETRGLRCFSSYSNRDDEYKGIYILNNSMNLKNTDASIACNYTRSDIEINCKKIKKIVIENNTGMMKDKKSVNIYTDKGYVMDYFSIHNPCMIGSVPEKARYCFNINNN